MLRITAVSAGAVDYLLRGSGCADHEHARERGHEAGKEHDAPGYFLSATEHGEAPGRWFGDGLDMLGIQPGELATEDDVRAAFGELKHPETGEYLGRAPRQFKDHAERLAAALAREPGATPERQREIELETKLDSRKAVAYYDFTFSPAKSVSVYYAALLTAGATEEAAAVLQAHREAVDIAMKYLEKHGAYVRTGYHGKTVNGRSVGRYERATGINGIAFDHSTNREKEPQLHTHFAVLNRSQTASDGEIRALDGKGFRPVKEAVASAYERTLEQLLTEKLGVRFALRPDGKAREILGVDPELCAEASTRRAQVQERVDELVEAYVDRHGREPSAAARKAIAQAATLETRAAKGDGEAGPEALRKWGQGRAEQLSATLDAVDAAAARCEYEGHPDRKVLPDQHDRQAILRAAVEEVQRQYPTWTFGNLVAAVDNQLISVPCAPEDRPAYVEALAREVLAPNSGYGTLLLTAPDLVAVPQVLQRPEDGRSIFRPHMDELYTTEEHLSTENRVVVGARQVTAPKVEGPEQELLRVELSGTNLGRDQVEAVMGVMCSGRAGDVLIGPAGAGKSRAVGELARRWHDQFGGRVLGLATSQRATQELAGNGLEAINTTQFLMQFTPDPLTGQARQQVQPGDLFVVDEAGMSATDELAQISALVEAGGGKLLYTGDPQQLSSVGAGGLLELLATDNGAFELEEIHRFADVDESGERQVRQWEADASMRLRAGDTSVLREYEDRGRLYGGTVEEMQDAAVRGYLADTMDGQESLLVVGTNQEAADLSRRVHDQLVDFGRVGEEVLAQGADRNEIAVGDVIQARRNDYNIQVDGGAGMVTNRMTYTVRGLDDRGRLVVGAADGTTAYLPSSYVQEHVTLAYASTINAAQGRTVDTSHDLLGEGSTREDAYTALTRGQKRNTAYLTTQRAPDEHTQEQLDVSPAGRLANIMDNVGADRAAELERRAGEEDAHSLAWLGTQWDEVNKEFSRDRYTDTLAGLLPADEMDALVAEPGYDRLMRSVRSAELAGHNAEAVLAEAVTSRDLDGANSVADVLRWRLGYVVADRQPEQVVDSANWSTFAPPTDGAVGQFTHELGVLASERQAAIGERAAKQLPAWAVDHLGLPPEDAGQRAEWVRRAGAAGAYRELRNVPEDQVSIGAAPSKEQEFHRALWQQANAALGRPADQLDYQSATEGELREMRARWQREQTWAPEYVADDMQAAYREADASRTDAALFRAQLERMDPDSPEYAETAAETERAERLAADYAERARQLEDIHAARAGWFVSTEPARVAHELAADELERRNLPVDLARPAEAEQQELFKIADEREVGPDPERPAAPVAEQERELDQAEQARQDAEAEPEQPALDAEPVEHVRWWQRWADRITGREDAPAAEPEPERAAPSVDEPEVTAAPADIDREPQRPEVDPDQGKLFDVEPSISDRVAAQPVRHAEVDQAAEDRELSVTLAEARRTARAVELLREQRDAAEAAKAEERRREVEAEQAEADRERRDQAERDAEKAPERERTPEAKPAEPARERTDDDPQIELVPTPTQPAPEPPAAPSPGPEIG